ncbi:MAG: diadenylate cyclase CdaA [Clostridia bacterium]|uniref:diadenylate cyclase CdaA n=1 Tax=Mogibacterium TaxID=86331 RepID=UPI0024091EDB|nr:MULTISPECIES: diadenylate cyclase CdaA [Mogibacterium]MCI7123474.1 diadenylate cyclase CdaA [Mogibacterium sp.]MDD6699671.1 diadenylate cyclase CdaA [Mogibacterium kristiansenii]MDY5450577.1 diadenylate cyclase CdaA [Clostridia bacterium]
MVEFFQNVFVGFRLIDVLDIVIVAYLVYKILGFIQETRAQQLVRGLVVLGIVFFLSDFLKLYLLNWLLRNFVTMGFFALIVLFQPELRRGLEQLGRRNIVSGQFRSLDKENAIEVVKEIVAAVDDFSATRTGALIVFERETMLNDIIETGTIVDARISVRLLGNLFYEGSPLHDGAVIIRGDRIHAASCVLPLTEKKNIGRNLGTRHRAGLGVSEVSDALVIVVSEETGVISVAENGNFRRFMDLKSVEKILLGVYMPQEETFRERMTRTLKHRRKEETRDGE